MKTIAIINLIKGGVSKSTLTANLAAAAQRDSKNVMIVDLDTIQKASFKWATIRNIPTLLNPPVGNLAKVVQKHDLTIFDTGGYDTSSAQALMSASDIILIPSSMSPIETEAFYELIHKINKIKEILKKETLNIYIVPTRIHPSISSTSIKDHFQPLEAIGYKIAPTIYLRRAYEKSYANGGSVFESSDNKAQSEIFNLYNTLSSPN